MIQAGSTRSALSLGLLVASLALSACSQEDYYCDDSGCYYCDGLGCRAIGLPSRSTCGCERDCTAGSVCTSLGCTIACGSTAMCPRGTVCEGGYCVHPTETAPSGSIACVCTGAADCDRFERPGEDLACVDGECVGRVTPRCSATMSCPEGRVCVEEAGECRLPSDVCHFSSECGPGRVCVNERCTSACGTDNPCPTGSICEGGFCREQPGTGSCSLSTECGAGMVCIDGSCWTACSTDGECGAGRYCAADGRCRIDDRPRPVCDASRLCAGGAVCVDGVCRSPCSTATDCRRFDEQLTVCVEMLCYTTNEASSDCDEALDCRTGQRCIDGICR